MNERNEVPAGSAIAGGHRDRKRARVRSALRQSALALFAERGFEQTTIDDIVAEVDLVPRTFFRYFRSKHDVLFDGLGAVREALRHAIELRPHGEGALCALLSAMRELLEAYAAEQGAAAAIGRLCATSVELRLHYAASRYDAQRQVARVLAARLASSDDVIAETIAAIGMTAAWIAVDAWIEDGATKPLRDYAETRFDIVMTNFRSIDESHKLA